MPSDQPRYRDEQDSDPTTAIPRSFERRHSGSFGGRSTEYISRAHETIILDKAGQPAASIFTVDYLVDGETERPVIFLFNGGPTSPAYWLHMGGFGPRRVVVPDCEIAGSPPYPVVDNEECLLDIADLVFVDPVGTGYSHALGTKKDSDYWGLIEDATSVADFIETWLTNNARWNCPIYLIGESYGTVRATLAADVLSGRSTSINGIVLISPVQDYQNSRPRPEDGAIMPYVSFLPSLAATAFHHGKAASIGQSLDEFLDEVREFASNEYACALIANHRLDATEFERIATRLAGYCGLDRSYVERSFLRIPVKRYFKELLRDRGVVVGRLDGRYIGTEPDDAGELSEADPSLYGVGVAFSAAMKVHLAALGAVMDRSYQLENFLDEKWNWQLEDRVPNGGGYVNVIPHLGRVLRRNSGFRVLVAMGLYDLATPFFGAENALSQVRHGAERITYRHYHAGHMIFLNEDNRRLLANDVRVLLLGTRDEMRA